MREHLVDKLRFWKRKPAETPEPESPVIKRFNVQPRTDVGTQGLPDDPDLAARVAATRRRRETLVNELRTAQSASDDDNRWKSEVTFIDQALGEIAGDLALIEVRIGVPGEALPAVPISGIAVTLEPVVSVQFDIGDEAFCYAEPIDWAERGTQLARSELNLESGDPSKLIPEHLNRVRAELVDHLQQSLFVFASDLRDRAIAGETMPAPTLLDLALPDATFGGWMDWSGHSPVEHKVAVERAHHVRELARLEDERAALLRDEARVAENLPFVNRRLAELDKELQALLQPEKG